MHVFNLGYILCCHLLYLDYLFSWYLIQFLRQDTKLSQSIVIGLYHVLHVFIRNTVFGFSLDVS